jgi:hypothetical protein
MFFKKINLHRRAKAWKAHVERALLEHANQIEKINDTHRTLLAQYETLAAEHDRLKSALNAICSQVLTQLIRDSTSFGKNERYCYARRGTWLRILRIPMHSNPPNCLVVREAQFYN